MMGSSGITESGNTTPMETSVPPATPVVDSEQPSAFQLALEQVTLPQEMPVTAETPILASIPLELAPVAPAPQELELELELPVTAEAPTETKNP